MDLSKLICIIYILTLVLKNQECKTIKHIKH